MGNARNKRGGKILRFAIGGSLLVSAPLAAGCSNKEKKDEPTVNEPAEENVNEPPEDEPTVNEPAEEEHVNEPAPDENEEPADEDGADTADE